jgi:hypothetical protein
MIGMIMEKYEVTLIETKEYHIEVEAKTVQDAFDIAEVEIEDSGEEYRVKKDSQYSACKI